MRRLLEHCGLEWHEACLEFQPKNVPVRTLRAAQVRQAVSSKGVGKWKPYAEHIAPLITCAENIAEQSKSLPEI